MVEIDYISRRGSRIMTREGSVVVDQFPGDKRRFVVQRPNGKKLKFELPGYTMRQQRDDESKWTRTGKIVEVRDFLVEDECPSCGHEMAELERVEVDVQESNVSDGPYMPRGGDWLARCTNCLETHDPQTTPNEPPWPEPDDLDDHGEVLQSVQEYAEHVNDEIFDGQINLGRVSWEWNSRNTNTAGRAWSYKIQLTPQYLEQHGWNEFLKVVRHEMIHVWENHAGHDSSGHSAQFHGWLVDANTRRHCKHF
jgi:predicted RNA-binding Zn-ribbon protein involved in translation (DUF1610 family)